MNCTLFLPGIATFVHFVMNDFIVLLMLLIENDSTLLTLNHQILIFSPLHYLDTELKVTN